MTQIQAEIILNLAKNNMNSSATARAMFLHRNSISYHIRMIRRNTGLDPKNFQDLSTLIEQAKEVLQNG